MKKADKKELRDKTASELQKHLEEGYEILAQLRMDNIQAKLKNHRSITNTRKSIAIIKTMIAEKAGEPEAPVAAKPVEKKKEEKAVKKTEAKEGKKDTSKK